MTATTPTLALTTDVGSSDLDPSSSSRFFVAAAAAAAAAAADPCSSPWSSLSSLPRVSRRGAGEQQQCDPNAPVDPVDPLLGPVNPIHPMDPVRPVDPGDLGLPSFDTIERELLLQPRPRRTCSEIPLFGNIPVCREELALRDYAGQYFHGVIGRVCEYFRFFTPVQPNQLNYISEE